LDEAINVALLDAALNKLGQLNDFWATGKSIASLKHCDQQAARAVAAAWNTYVKLHPEIDRGE
jgi:hypothetical protein